MSDQTPGPDEEDEEDRVRPRHQSAAERRSSETVMLDSSNLGDMVASAKSEPGSASAQAASSPEIDEEEETRKNIILIVGVAVIIVVAGLVAYFIYIAPD